MSKVDVDDSEIKSITGISISEVSGDFSPEWLSCNFINNVISEINSLIGSFNEAKSKADSYTNVNEEISNQEEPYVPQTSGGHHSSNNSSHRDSSLYTVGNVEFDRATTIGSGMSNLVIANALKESKVTIIEVDDGSGWTKIQLEDNTQGYVPTKYIQIENDSESGILTSAVDVLSIKPSVTYSDDLYNDEGTFVASSMVSGTKTTTGTYSTTKKSSPEIIDIMKRVSTEEGEETL